MSASYGAHEVMELQEVLTTTIDGIHLLQLYRPLVKDQKLTQLLDHQLQFMVKEYDSVVQLLQQQGQQNQPNQSGVPMGQMAPVAPYRAPKQFSPSYGLDHPPAQSPNASMNQLDERDIASGVLGIHKAGAVKKMTAALEIADPQLRRIVQQCAVNCSEQAYEVWQYMNDQGYYQVPTMKEVTTHTMLNTFDQAGQGGQAGASAGTMGSFPMQQDDPALFPMQTQHMQQGQGGGMMSNASLASTFQDAPFSSFTPGSVQSGNGFNQPNRSQNQGLQSMNPSGIPGQGMNPMNGSNGTSYRQ